MIQRASPWSPAEVARATGGQLIGPPAVILSGVSTDTRDALSGCLFVALEGERFDAHEFLDRAIDRGAAALLVSTAGLARARARGFAREVPLIVVADTLRALGDLGAAHRARRSANVIALTGSNGKTTTKEMLAAILSSSRRVLKTEGNLNNLIGVPMTLLGLEPEHELAVIEMGMNTPGEIARYTEIARPDVGMVINVGPAHIGMLGSIEAIARAKGELYAGLDRERAVAVVNIDDPHVFRVAAEAGVARTRTFGTAEGAHVRLVSYEAAAEGGRARFVIDGATLDVEIPIAGAHNAMNAAAAIAAATAPIAGRLPATAGDIVAGLPKLARVGRRMVFESVGPYLLVDDCYNANSASMLAAIETVAGRGARFVAVLGEMRELGDYSDREHRLVGEALAKKSAAVVAAFGPLAKPIAEGAGGSGLVTPSGASAESASREVAHEAEDVDKLFGWLAPRLRSGDVILVKGSRGAKMERFIDKIRALAAEGNR